MAWTRFCTSAGSGVAAWIVVSSTLSSKLRYFLKVRTSRLMLRPVADSIIRLTASVAMTILRCALIEPSVRA